MKHNVACAAVALLVLLSLSISLLYVSDKRSTCSQEIEFLPSSSLRPVEGDRNIFFVETSCAVNSKPSSNYSYSSGLVLTPRAACSIESAALANPRRPVFLVHSCRVDEADPLRGAPPFARQLFALPNVYLWNASFDLLFKDSPLEDLIASGILKKSKWPESHGSDILRYFLLWKYGGTYLDTDVLVLRPLDELHDFTCAESLESVSAGAMDFSWQAPGRLLAEMCLKEIQTHFNPSAWAANGPEVITRSLRTVCNVRKIKEMTVEKCQGFQLLPTDAIYPVYYPKWKTIFDESRANEVMNAINGSYALHVWNALSKGTQINTSSNQAYAQLARKVCPAVIANVGDFM